MPYHYFNLLYLAHELRTWLLYYSLPTLREILPNDYLVHHVALVAGLYRLLKDCVDDVDLSEATVCLNYYCSVFSDLYGAYIDLFVFCYICLGCYVSSIMQTVAVLHLCKQYCTVMSFNSSLFTYTQVMSI